MRSSVDGILRHFVVQQANESFFERDKIVGIPDQYTFGRKLEEPDGVNWLYDRVMHLVLKKISRDPMTGDKFTHNIIGLTLNDFLNMDHATFVDIESRMEALEEEYTKELRARAAEMNTKPPPEG